MLWNGDETIWAKQTEEEKNENENRILLYLFRIEKQKKAYQLWAISVMMSE